MAQKCYKEVLKSKYCVGQCSKDIFKRYKDIFEGAYRSRVCPLEPFKYFDYSGVEEQIELALPDSSAPSVLASVSRPKERRCCVVLLQRLLHRIPT